MSKMNKEANNQRKGVSKEKLAVIRIRGLTGVRRDIDASLKKLRLYKKNYCVVVPKNEGYLGMIEKVKDYVTWGEIEGETYNALLEKRKEEYKPNSLCTIHLGKPVALPGHRRW